jgi:hypothetical protein
LYGQNLLLNTIFEKKKAAGATYDRDDDSAIDSSRVTAPPPWQLLQRPPPAFVFSLKAGRYRDDQSTREASQRRLVAKKKGHMGWV